MMTYHYLYGTARIQDDSSTVLVTTVCITVVMLGYDWWLCMVINIELSVQYSGGLLPDITLC